MIVTEAIKRLGASNQSVLLFMLRTSGPLKLIFCAKGLRDFADGFLAILLPLYLVWLGFSSFEIGLLAGTALLGSAALTLLVGFVGIRYDPRKLLLLSASLMAATGAALLLTDNYLALLAVGFIGTVNPSGGSSSAFVPVEHTVLTHEAESVHRTKAFAHYSLIGGLSAAAGALASAVPDLLPGNGPAGMKLMFAVYALLGCLSGILYSRVPRQPVSMSQSNKVSALGPSRKIVYRLAMLFSLDAFAGGLVVQSLLALWLFQRFDLSLAEASVFFFWSGLLSAFSFPVAAWLAGRIGLINTMVLTHIPSSLCLILAAFAPNLTTTLLLLLARAALSQMDVPTRSSYVMAVVTPPERTAAASFTSVPRTLAASVSPAIAGALFSASLVTWPLILCGALKISYDLLLLNQFRLLKPPEETKKNH